MGKNKQAATQALQKTVRQLLLVSEKRLGTAKFSVTLQNDREGWKIYQIRLQSGDFDVRARVLVSTRSNPYACAVCIESFHDGLRDPDNWYHPYSWNHLHVSL